MILKADISYPIREEKLRLNLDFDLAGKILGINGPSGSGKTSFLNILCGLRTPETGRIDLGDRILFDKEQGLNTPPHQRRIGYVFQDYRLFPHLNVEKNLKFGKGLGREICPFEEVVELLELAPLLKRKPAALSGGEKQRTALGRTLIAGPELLLLDEPFSALDPRLREQSAEWIFNINRKTGLPMILVTHSRKELFSIADNSLEFRDGAASGPFKCIGITA